MYRSSLVVLSACVALAGCSSGSKGSGGGGGDGGPPSGALDVMTDKGPVHGAADSTTRQFLGIPFAAPPTGALRFMPPKDPDPWTTPLQATSLPAECMQLDNSGNPASGASEDCLYLNVWTPLADVKNAPVFVWIYGGGFITGSSGGVLYNGENVVAKTGAIVVTLNYRLGPLGFLSHPAFATAEGVATSPSQGLLDQQLALKWVQSNIAAFGGDPANVTLAGESAGGISTCTHLAAPGSKGTFAHAIIESGPCVASPLLYQDKAAAEAQGNRLAMALGCTDAATAVACLQGKTPQQILTALPLRHALLGATGESYGFVLDGTVLPMPPLAAIAAGQFASVPTIGGSNVNEGQLFLYLWGSPPPTAADVRGALGAAVGPNQVAQISAKYPVDSNPTQAFVDIITDGLFACPARRLARTLNAAGAKAYLYQFTYPYTTPLIPGVTTGHSFEIPFVFRNAPIGMLGDADLAMADIVDGYWFSMVASGDPNSAPAAGAPMWPAYTPSGDQNVTLDSMPSVTTGLKKAICDFWDTVL